FREETHMILTNPIWLLLALPLAVSLMLWHFPSRLLLALRVALLLLLLVALCDPALRLPSRAGTVVVVADPSPLMPPDTEAAQKEAIRLIQGGMTGQNRLAVVAFGKTAAVEQAPQSGPFAGFVNEVGPDASNLTEALETAMALIPPDSPGKIVLLSDGRWTGRDPASVAARAAARGVTIDYRPLERSSANDLAIGRIDAPATVTPGESFLITAWVRSPVRQKISFELRRG